MPYLGHQSPDFSDLELSPLDTPAAEADLTVDRLAVRTVGRMARDSDEFAQLVQMLGLQPAVSA